jgi:hypothetical protein
MAQAQLKPVSIGSSGSLQATWLAQTTSVQAVQAQITQVLEDGLYEVLAGNQKMQALVGCLMPELVVGDVVSAYVTTNPQVALSITALLLPHPATPLSVRAIHLSSEQSITLKSGAVTFKMTAAGLARIVAHAIEQDARDSVDIDAGEVRIN